MTADKNLFMYDLAVVTFIKNPTPYIKSWLNYTWLAGTYHFFIYDNDESGEVKNILQPYIEQGIVTYIFFPGNNRQYEAYNNAVQNFKFLCRYMAFIDVNEFIFPKADKKIAEIVEDILIYRNNAAGLAVNLNCYNLTGNIKLIANPRKIDYFYNQHYAVFFQGLYAVNENGDIVEWNFNNPPTVEKIVVNQYRTNEVDNEIIEYCRGRNKLYTESDDERKLRIYNALCENLLSVNPENFPENFLTGKLETFLTCAVVAEKFQFQYQEKFITEYALYWLYKSFFITNPPDDLLMVLSALPEILKLKYSLTEKIREACIDIIPKLTEFLRLHMQDGQFKDGWQKIVELNRLLKMLQSF